MSREYITLGHYNVFRKNSGPIIREDVERMTLKASVFDLNEGHDHSAIEAALKENGYHWTRTRLSDWLCWDPKVWDARQWHHTWKLSNGAPNYEANPPRYLLAQSLEHRSTGTLHDFFATHLTAGYTRREGYFPDAKERAKDHAARTEIMRLDRITDACIRQRTRVDYHYLQGDMNAEQMDSRAVWYPANVWRDTWHPDSLEKSIDWMMSSRQSFRNGLNVRRRWTEGQDKGWHSDHRAHFRQISIPS